MTYHGHREHGYGRRWGNGNHHGWGGLWSMAGKSITYSYVGLHIVGIFDAAREPTNS